MLNAASAAGAAGATQSLGGAAPTNNLDRDAFLQLLLAQLEHQDPLSPMENEAFVSQLAEFSSLEQMQSINQNLQNSIDADLLLNQVMNNSLVTTLIGKDVVATADSFVLGNEGEVELGFRAQTPANGVKVEIRDASGGLVDTIDVGSVAEGDRFVKWDGKTSDGKTLPPGRYTFSVTRAAGGDSETFNHTPLIRGNLTGVRYQNGQAFLLLGETELNLSDVERINQARQG